MLCAIPVCLLKVLHGVEGLCALLLQRCICMQLRCTACQQLLGLIAMTSQAWLLLLLAKRGGGWASWHEQATEALWKVIGAQP